MVQSDHLCQILFERYAKAVAKPMSFVSSGGSPKSGGGGGEGGGQMIWPLSDANTVRTATLCLEPDH